MSDFDLVSIYHILVETMGIWLWIAVAVAVVALLVIIAGFARLRGAARPAGGPLGVALAAGAVVTVVATFFVPVWTLADAGALLAPVDYVFAVLLGLVPGGITAVAVFYITAARSALR